MMKIKSYEELIKQGGFSLLAYLSPSHAGNQNTAVQTYVKDVSIQIKKSGWAGRVGVTRL